MSVAPQPSRRRRRWLIAGGVVLVLVATAVVIVSPMGGGYASKIACSEVFVAGRALSDVEREDLSPYGFIAVSVNGEQGTATAKVLGLLATAVYREGLGCAVAVKSAVESLSSQAFTPPRATPRHGAWPEGDGVTIEPIEGLNREALAAAIGEAFNEPDASALRRTRALLVVHDGKLVAERYGDGFNKESLLLGWSMTKSVTHALVGIAVKRGLLRIDDRPGFEAWSADARRAITVDQLLRMSSGLSFDETYLPLTDATAMLFETEDAAASALAHELTEPPDTHWSYSSGTTNLLSKLMRDRIHDDAAYHRFPYEELFVPLGMHSAVLEADGSGTFIGSSFMYATAQDWARFGLLYLNDGLVGETRLLPEGWVDYASTPTLSAPLGNYGAQFWLNAGSASGRPFPTLPRDLFYASGYQGQKVAIVPSHNAVIVRLGMTHRRDAFPFEAITKRILEALPPAH